jgi:transposase-like protein
MYCWIISSLILPDLIARYLRAQRSLPQNCSFICRNSANSIRELIPFIHCAPFLIFCVRSRRLTPHQKLQILKELEATGNGVEVAQRYQLHPQTLYLWRKAMEQGAQVFLSGEKSRVDPRLRKLEKENEKLKEALVLQTQELMLLKKEMNLV